LWWFAAEACLLILNRPTSLYSKLRSILVYPDAFVAQREQPDAAGVLSNHPVGLLGESWDNGRIVLSWDDVERGAHNFTDGHNVVLNEFAHQLDSEAGGCNGTPRLKPSRYQSWAKVLSAEFAALQHSAAHHKHAVEDYYGATNPAEFFAVATETFFEKPQLMASKQPHLFNELADYYCVDPRQWQD
jgi:Mlc titration factor MtfA (ptsG expression regulator)